MAHVYPLRQEEAPLSNVRAVSPCLYRVYQVCCLTSVHPRRFSYLLPWGIRLYCWEAEVVCELVLLEVREDDGCEGGEEGWAFVYRAVVNSFPDLFPFSWFPIFFGA
jgi:hypothetical protein